MTPRSANPATLEAPRAAERPSEAADTLPAAWGVPLLALLPGALTLYLSFQSGGFFPGATGVAALALILFLLWWVLLAQRPVAGFSVPLGVAAGALILLAVWTLASAGWSDAAARALTEFDRLLLYLLVLVVFGSLPRTSTTARWLIYGLAGAMTLVCLSGFITRTVPDFWSAPPEFQRNRLSYPVGYWNALGLMA